MNEKEDGNNIRHVRGIFWQDVRTNKYYWNDETERLYPEWDNPQPYDTIEEAEDAATDYAINYLGHSPKGKNAQA